ncbi:hypothetical protein ABT373_37335 [Streptomyces sp. NPDC000070]|uniref:hypothetical protein n=1 Tax=Streptomyces sp. NPDC000070 TaxID=3154240 RepID=UPI00331D5D0B
MADGHSNRCITESLFLTEETVTTHFVTHLPEARRRQQGGSRLRIGPPRFAGNSRSSQTDAHGSAHNEPIGTCRPLVPMPAHGPLCKAHDISAINTEGAACAVGPLLHCGRRLSAP